MPAWMFRSIVSVLLVTAACHGAVAAGSAAEKPRTDPLAGFELPEGVFRSAEGVTRQETEIPCLLTADDLDFQTAKTRVLLVGGLDGANESVAATLGAMTWFYTDAKAKSYREAFALSCVPCGNPDGWASKTGPANGAGGDPWRGYPPKGPYYDTKTDPEAAYLWRWIGMSAPDIVVDVRGGKTIRWGLPSTGAADGKDLVARLTGSLKPAGQVEGRDELINALGAVAPCDVGTIFAVKLETPASTEFLPTLLAALSDAKFQGPSAARKEIQRRIARTPLEVAKQLSQRYGHALPDVAYIPSVALIGRLRLGDLASDPSQLADVEKIVAPYFEGKKPTLPKQPAAIGPPGHLVFGELADRTRNDRYIALAKAGADVGFDEQGRPKPSMPAHSEMSDSFFMGCPILAQVGRLTGDAKYYDMCLRHLRFMRKLTLRGDGLHRHSPLDEGAWGRGNGFPALGLALSLSDLPADFAGREEILKEYIAHLTALAAHQDPTGAWHQVVDRPGSYRELTVTCMVGVAMTRGVRSGWLPAETWEPRIARAWMAAKSRIGMDNRLVDVCTGTGKQKSLRDYYDRPAILGFDDRGGAMAILFATEIALWENEKSSRGK